MLLTSNFAYIYENFRFIEINGVKRGVWSECHVPTSSSIYNRILSTISCHVSIYIYIFM